MKIYYQVGDGPWIKGDMSSMSGGREVHFSRWDEENQRYRDDVTLWNPEYLFHDTGMHVTGWQRLKDEGDNRYTLTSVDVKTYRPKEKKE